MHHTCYSETKDNDLPLRSRASFVSNRSRRSFQSSWHSSVTSLFLNWTCAPVLLRPVTELINEIIYICDICQKISARVVYNYVWSMTLRNTTLPTNISNDTLVSKWWEDCQGKAAQIINEALLKHVDICLWNGCGRGLFKHTTTSIQISWPLINKWWSYYYNVWYNILYSITVKICIIL